MERGFGWGIVATLAPLVLHLTYGWTLGLTLERDAASGLGFPGSVAG